MRPDLTAGQQTLLETGSYWDYWELKVANGSGTMVDLSTRLIEGLWRQPSPNNPVGSLSLQLVREFADPTLSISPLVGSSTLNRLDDGTTYSPLLLMGRTVTLKVACVAKGTARPAAGSFVEVFRGKIDRVSAPGEWDDISVECSDQAGILMDTWTENAQVYAAGTDLEDVIQGVLDAEFGAGTYTLEIPVATGEVTTSDFEPDDTVWNVVSELAAKLGWVIWFRYDATGAAKLTLFEPDRAKSAADFEMVRMRDITALDFDKEDIRNVVEGFSQDDDEAEITKKVEDATSIAKYGSVRRYMRLVEPEGSVIRTEAQLEAYVNAALSDTKDPDAIMQATVPFFWPGEVSEDLYTFPEAEHFFEDPQDLAPFEIQHVIRGGIECSDTILRVRGAPTAGAKTWTGRSDSRSSRPDRLFSIYDLRETTRSDTSLAYEWTWGAEVVALKFFTGTVAQADWSDSWPAVDDAHQNLWTDPATENSYTFTIPTPGRVVYAQWVPILRSGMAGIVRRLLIPPTLVEPDLIRSITALVNDDDGSVAIRVEVADRTASIRYAYAVGASPTWSTDVAVEAGTIATPTSNVVSISLASGTVPYNQMIRVRAAPYTGAAGTGTGGATDHGDIKGAEDIRLDPAVSLEMTTESESTTTGTFGVTVRDAGGYATDLYYATKSGTGAWSAWTLKTADPANDTEYTQTVTLIEDHHSFIKFRLDYTINGETGSVTAESGGFDRGKIPDIQVIPDYNAKLRTASCTLVGDFDTASFKVLASTSGYPSDANVRLETALNGRVLTPGDIGALISNLTPGQTVYFNAFGYSSADGGGNESSAAKTAQITIESVAPVLEKTTESETSTTGTSGVTVRDPSGLATGLDYRVKSGTGAFGAWTSKDATPNDGVEYTETVTLMEDHLSFIEWRLKYELLGQTHYFPMESAGFDKGKIPDVGPPALSQTELGAVTAAFVGDFDTASVKYAHSTSAHPNETTVRAATAVDSRQFTTGTLATLSLGQTLYISWFGYSATGGGGNEQTVMGKAQISRQAAFIPKVKESVSWSGSTATVTLTITDSRLRVSAVTWQTLTQGVSDGAASGTFDTTTTGTLGSDAAIVRAEAVTIAAGKDVAFLYVVTYSDENGDSKTIGGTIPLSNLQSRTVIKRVPFTAFVGTPLPSYLSNGLNPDSASNRIFRAAVEAPAGSTLQEVRAHISTTNAGDIVTMTAHRVPDGGGVGIQLASPDSNSTTGYETLEIVPAYAVQSNETYTCVVNMDGAAASTDTLLQSAEFEFTLPSYANI
jgi:hypothetical protein